MAKKRDRKDYLKAWREKNKDILKAKRDSQKEEQAIKNKLYREEHREKLNKYSLEWNKNHKEYLVEYRKKTRSDTREKCKIRRHTDLEYRISINLRARFTRAVKNNYKTGSAVQDLGCSIEFFKKYITDRFSEGMSWENYGTFWNFDHIIPLSKFDLTKREEVLMACHYTNIKPMLTSENCSKNNKSEEEYLEYKRGI